MLPYTAYLIDLDGVVWRGDHVLPGARDFVAWLDSSGLPYRYLSNNSMIAPPEVAAKLRRLGIPCPDMQVVTASSAAARLLRSRFDTGPIWVTGLASLRQMMHNAGLHVLNLQANDRPDDPAWPAERATAVLVGLDRSLTYAGLQQATRAVLAGATLIGVNRDAQLPVEDGYDPGCGSILAALEVATRRKAEIVGKPSPAILLEAMREMGVQPDQTAIIGDGLEMDIAAGHAAGTATILVLSGFTNEAQAWAANPPPTAIYRDLADVLAHAL